MTIEPREREVRKYSRRHAGDDILVIDETEEHVSEVTVALGGKGEVADARLAIGVQAIDWHSLCESEGRGGERGECATQAVAGDPERLRFVLERCNVGENQFPYPQEANREALVRVANTGALQ